MSGFSLRPAGGGAFPPVTPQEFPNFIQFRFNGVDLGGRDATVVNFAGGVLQVERGTGADANKITVSLSSEMRVAEDGSWRDIEAGGAA